MEESGKNQERFRESFQIFSSEQLTRTSQGLIDLKLITEP